MTTVKNAREERGTGSRERGEQWPIGPAHLRAVRLGHGGNCSSVGSVIDTLFLGAAAIRPPQHEGTSAATDAHANAHTPKPRRTS
jgi:hypothetical protein